MSLHRLSGLRYKGQCFCQLAKARSPKGKGQVLSSPVASNEASALLPAGRPGGRVARDDNAMCWDGCLLLCSGGKKPAGRATRDECLERRMCAATMARRTTPRMRKALPMVGRHTERAGVCLGWFRPASRVGACRNLRHGSGIHTHRQVVAGPVCRGIVMCAAINTMLRQPALLLQFGGPSLRRAVTVPICLMPNPVAPALQQQACFPGLLAAFRCQPCTR